jgi:multidrug resistance efflux pump
LGDGKSAYFQEGSLEVVVVPEPATIGLLGLGTLIALLTRYFRR